MSITSSVGARAHDLDRALQIISHSADRGADPQPALRIPGGERVLLVLEQILGGHQTGQTPLGIDERELLDLARDHQALGVGQRHRSGVHHQRVARGHPLGNERVRRNEPDVALGQQADQAVRLVDDRQRADTGLLHESNRVGHPLRRSDAVRIGDDAVLPALHRGDLHHLRLDVAGPEAAIDDADAAFLGHHDGHGRARHGVHVGRHERALERQLLGEARREIHSVGVAPRQNAELRGQQEVVERAAANEVEEVHPDASLAGAAANSSLQCARAKC